MNSNSDKTHFGYEEIPTNEKTSRVREVFRSVADRYDIMNDLMSLGIHRLWKKIAVDLGAFSKGHVVLDLAGGTGDLTAKISSIVGEKGRVFLTDINENMLHVGRSRLIDKGIFNNVSFVQADAEQLPFADDHFDRIIIGFGLRNVTHKEHALKSMYRVLKPGGRIIVLEFSKPILKPLASIYDAYSFHILPLLGKIIAKDESSYRYLAESIRVHPDQETLQKMMEEAGFEKCSYHNLSAGIVAVHKGYKF